MSDADAYGTFNIGAGFAVYADPSQSAAILKIAGAAGYTAWNAGTIRKEGGRKAVIIEPLQITYDAESLQLR